MSSGNGSRAATEFVLTGFPGLHPQYQGPTSALLLLVYSSTLVGNATIFFLFATDRCLHKPMYYIILNLCACDIIFSSATLPKIIGKYWFRGSGVISFTGCFVQMYFVHYLGSVNSFILFLMALDRYFAICHPLRYSVILKKSTINGLSVGCWLVATICPIMMVIRAYPLPYCASNLIRHCFCDHIGITVLACTDRAPYAFPAFTCAMIVLLGPLSFIVFSYASIIVAVRRIADAQGRLKSLSTCSTQLIVILLYYLPRCFVYLARNAGIRFSPDVRIVIVMMYSLLPPTINPLIYCLRAKDMRESLRRRLQGWRVAQKAQVATVSD